MKAEVTPLAQHEVGWKSAYSYVYDGSGKASIHLSKELETAFLTKSGGYLVGFVAKRSEQPIDSKLTATDHNYYGCFFRKR